LAIQGSCIGLSFHKLDEGVPVKMFRRPFLTLLFVSILFVGCGDPGGQVTSTSTSGGDPANVLTLELPQAMDGAMWANPFTYAEIPLHVNITGTPTHLDVVLDGKTFVATEDGGGSWTAKLPIAGMKDGEYEVTVKAEGDNAMPVSITATLALGGEGRQLTVYDEVGLSRSPQLVLQDGHLELTWIDRSAGGNARLYKSRVDGAGRLIGDRVTLAASPNNEILWAFVAHGKSSLGILYKESGTPYKTFFKMVDATGKELSAPVALDPVGMDGSWGGDIAYDGSGYVAVWRSFDGTANELRWVRFDEQNAMMSGPVVIAAAGSGDPIGGFDAFTFLKVKTTVDQSVVTFVREHWSVLLGLDIPRSEIAVVKKDGSVIASGLLGNASDFTWHHESRVFDVGGQLVSLRTESDLNDPATNPEIAFYASRINADGTLTKGDLGTKMFTALDAREEPHFTAHPGAFGALMWLDDRKYSVDVSTGHIDLYVALVNDDLTTREATVFENVSFYAGLAELNGVAVGTNVPMFWIDRRHSAGIDTKWELYFDTAWY
jgi:hypothetical protein